MNTPASFPVRATLPLALQATRRDRWALFTGGFSVGWLHYLHRSFIPIRHVPGSNAWWPHAAVAGVAIAIMTVTLGRRIGRIGPHVLLSPLKRSAADRISVLFRRALWRPASFVRTVLATPLLLLVMFGLFRVGYQITSGLDPNDTVNAWGGPTYIGAMACHYLDFAVIVAAAALLLNVILPRLDRHAGDADSCSGFQTTVARGQA
jgi:hypothetical protein